MEGKRRGGKGLIGLPMCNPGYAYGRYCYFLITIHFIWGPRGQAFGWGPWPLPPGAPQHRHWSAVGDDARLCTIHIAYNSMSTGVE